MGPTVPTVGGVVSSDYAYCAVLFLVGLFERCETADSKLELRRTRCPTKSD